MKCPDDRTALLVHSAEDRTGWKCTTCSGIWLPNSFIQSLEADHPQLLESFKVGNEFRRPDSSRRTCPEGHGVLQTVESKGVELDWCISCGGYWFDNGELAKIQAATRNNGSSWFGWEDILFFFGPGRDKC
jgi:Zn-finger nucleic acid-binding protein